MADHSPQARTWSPTALPSPLARATAFGAILLGGNCGMLIGWRFADLQCSANNCTLLIAAGTIVGSVMGAGGIAIVAVMALRAMSEWRKPLDT